MTRKNRREIIKRRERYRGVTVLLKAAVSLLLKGEDDFIINQINTLIDKIYNQNDLRYTPRTMILRAIRQGFCKKDVIEAKTLISGDLLKETLEKLTLSNEIKYEDGMYIESFQ